MNVSVIAELERRHIPYELLPHARTTTAAGEAAALQLEPAEVAKTLVLATPQDHVRALLPASERIDPRKVAALLGVDEVRLVSETELAHDYPEFELGAVPPVGGHLKDRVLVDRKLEEHPWIAFEAGRHDESVRVRTGDLLAATDAVVADITLA